MKKINGFFRKIDSFGVSYTFKYKTKEKYTTPLGGVITLLFTIIAVTTGIYNFIPFYNKKNFTTIYYILKLAETEQVSFDKSKMSFSIGLNCWTGNDGTKAEDLFEVIHKYIYWDVQNGEYVRKTDTIRTHPCTYADFYNDFNKSFDDSKVYNYQCLDDLSREIEGIYASPIFSYYEFNVNAKNNSKKLLDKIEGYLIENDCKLQIYYIDKTIDIDDYKNPIKSYLETDFIQLNPTLSIRRNMYFMNQHLYDEDSYILVFNDQNEKETQLSSLYSRYEEYSLYQGLNRTNTSSDYLNWVKLFFRADTRKTDVKRKYQNLLEFYADASSLLIAFYEILLIIFNLINNFYAEFSLSKQIFFFKELKDNNFDINKNTKKISELLIEVRNNQKSYNFKPLFTKYKNQRNYIQRNNNPTSNIFSDNIITIEKKSKRNSSNRTLSKIEILSINKYDVKSDSIDQSIDKIKSHKLQTDEVSFKNGKSNNNKNSTIKDIDYNNINEKSSINNYQNIKYKFNVFEIFIASFCQCCLLKNLKIKNNLNEKANDLLNNSLDIVSFVRNHMLFNIINETILDENIKSIVNFLCRPIISIHNDNTKNELSEFYKVYKEKNFGKFSEELIQIIQKPKKNLKEKKLIEITEKHLKQLSLIKV